MVKNSSHVKPRTAHTIAPKSATKTPAVLNRRDTKWLDAGAPLSSGKLAGVIFAAAIIVPVFLATILEGAFGDTVAVAVLLALGLIAIYTGIRLLMEKYLLVPVSILMFAASCVFCVYITSTMQW